MKYFLLFISSILSFVIYSQTNDYFQSGSQWRINSTGLSMNASCAMNQQYVCEATGDTIIGVNSYKKTIYHGLAEEMGIFGWMGPCQPDTTFSEHYAFLRQENQKIYLYDRLSEIDTLLYDFNLQIGDFLPLTYNNSDPTIEVTSISSIQVGSETRKIFHFNQGNGIDSLIEGIGHNMGLIGTMQPFEFFEYELMCFAINGTRYYPTQGAFCDLTVETVEITPEISFTLSPNPAVDFVQINFSEGLDFEQLYLIDLFGKKHHLPQKKINSNTLELNVSSLENGMYFVYFQIDKNEFYIEKFIK